MAKNYAALAQDIVRLVGGESNVTHFEHCSTRLRFTVADASKVEKDKLKATTGVMDASGAEILMHIGMDTVQLNGKYYEAMVKAGDKVQKGQLLIKFDLDSIKAAGYDVTTPVVITNSDDVGVKTLAQGAIGAGTALLKWE